MVVSYQILCNIRHPVPEIVANVKILQIDANFLLDLLFYIIFKRFMAFYSVSDAFWRNPGFVLIGHKPLNKFVLCFNVNRWPFDPGLNILEPFPGW